MSYENELRDKAYRIWQKCNDWVIKVQKNGTTLDATQRQEMQTWSQIPSLFEPFAQLPDPNSGAFTAMIDDLKSALSELSDGHLLPPSKQNAAGETVPYIGDMAHINIQTKIDGWTGSAAQTFTESFLNPFPGQVQSQFVAVYVLRSAMQAYQNVWKNARDDAMKIADKTLDAVEHDCGSGGGGGAMALTVVGSVASVATAFAGPVSGAVLILELIAGATQIGAQAAGQSKQEINVSGADPLAVVPKLRQALSKLKQFIIHEQDDVYRVVYKDLKELEDKKHKLIVKRPELAGANRGNIKQMMGHSH